MNRPLKWYERRRDLYEELKSGRLRGGGKSESEPLSPKTTLKTGCGVFRYSRQRDRVSILAPAEPTVRYRPRAIRPRHYGSWSSRQRAAESGPRVSATACCA